MIQHMLRPICAVCGGPLKQKHAQIVFIVADTSGQINRATVPKPICATCITPLAQLIEERDNDH